MAYPLFGMETIPKPVLSCRFWGPRKEITKNCNELPIELNCEIKPFPYKMRFVMPYAKLRAFCLVFNVFIHYVFHWIKVHGYRMTIHGHGFHLIQFGVIQSLTPHISCSDIVDSWIDHLVQIQPPSVFQSCSDYQRTVGYIIYVHQGPLLLT